MRTTGLLVLPHEFASATVARHHVTQMLRRQGVRDDRCDDAALIVSELVGNALRHARPRGDGTIVVRWRLGPERLRVEVTDGGAPTRPEVQRPTRSGMEVAGRGLAIIDVLTDDWGVREDTDETTVWATLPAAHPVASG